MKITFETRYEADDGTCFPDAQSAILYEIERFFKEGLERGDKLTWKGMASKMISEPENCIELLKDVIKARDAGSKTDPRSATLFTPGTLS